MLEYFESRIKYFRAGVLKIYLSNWHTVTSDSETMQTVAGLPIELSAHSAFTTAMGYPICQDTHSACRECKITLQSNLSWPPFS